MEIQTGFVINFSRRSLSVAAITMISVILQDDIHMYSHIFTVCAENEDEL